MPVGITDLYKLRDLQIYDTTAGQSMQAEV